MELNKNWRLVFLRVPFLELCAKCALSFKSFTIYFNRYDKREDISVTSPEIRRYSHLLMEANDTRILQLQDTHRPLVFIEGYKNTAFNAARFPPVSVRLEKKTVLMERKPVRLEEKR